MRGGGSIKNNRILLSFIGLVAFLLLASVVYIFVSDNDPYEHYTGLGDSISISPDDTTLAFSYYMNGNEAIYAGDIESKNVERVTNPDENAHSNPQFSPDGNGLLYFSANHDGVQTLYYKPDLNRDETIKLTGADTHVSSAVISPDGSTVYYIAMPSSDFGTPEEERQNGADLHSVNIDGSQPQKRTDKDAFNMNELSISADGTTLYYTAFHDGKQYLFAYNLEDGTENVLLQEDMPSNIGQPVLSPDEELLAYTAVADTSENGTYLYELFLMDISSGETKRLTDYNARITSPAFFHQQNRIVFLGESNWPSEPSFYEIMTVSNDNEGAVPLELDLPESSNNIQPGAIADSLVSPMTITGLYLLLFGLLTVYYHTKSNKTYFPAKLSAILTGVIFLSAIIVFAIGFAPNANSLATAFASIGILTLALGLVGCTAVIFIFAFIYRRLVKR